MSKIKQWSLKNKIFACLGAVLLGIIGLWGYNYYMEQQKVNNLYKHGFRLLEEQIATYIVENYSGVSKVEFSPIFVDGDGRFTVRTVNVVPVVYDEQGNRALLGGTIGDHTYARYGLDSGVWLDFDVEGSEIIEIEGIDSELIEVQQFETLPSEARLMKSPQIDENIQALVGDRQLENVEKSSKGSPDAKVIYNSKIEKGEYWEWR